MGGGGGCRGDSSSRVYMIHAHGPKTMLRSEDVLRQDSATHPHLRTEHGELRPLVSGRVGCCLD